MNKAVLCTEWGEGTLITATSSLTQKRLPARHAYSENTNLGKKKENRREGKGVGGRD